MLKRSVSRGSLKFLFSFKIFLICVAAVGFAQKPLTRSDIFENIPPTKERLDVLREVHTFFLSSDETRDNRIILRQLEEKLGWKQTPDISDADVILFYKRNILMEDNFSGRPVAYIWGDSPGVNFHTKQTFALLTNQEPPTLLFMVDRIDISRTGFAEDAVRKLNIFIGSDD